MKGTVHGILVVDKPAGPTSHDVVDEVRRALGERRVGHTGTLDPFATGVLPVCVGKATRLARFLSESDKTYEGVVRFGFATTTDDDQGEPVGETRPVTFDIAAVRAAAAHFVGPIDQQPPAYSARRIDGRRMYDMARAGEAFERPARRVTIRDLSVGVLEDDRVTITVRCSAGTYIRSLARDLGAHLGIGAHLVALRRTMAAGFTLADAITLDAVRSGSAAAAVRPLSSALSELPAVTVNDDGRAALRHGRSLARRLVAAGFPDTPPARLRVLDSDGTLLALAVPQGFGHHAPELPVEPVLHPDVVLAD